MTADVAVGRAGRDWRRVKNAVVSCVTSVERSGQRLVSRVERLRNSVGMRFQTNLAVTLVG